jgi:serine/threonine protein kinase
MGTVYRAVQLSLDRVVAIKVPHDDARDDPSVRKRFRTEARAGARVFHRNIVRVLDYGEDAEMPFLVMEHVPGPTLGELVADRGGLPPAIACDVVDQVLAALEESHVCGVVHADVKCDNVLVETRRDGGLVPRLIDFGLARFRDPEPETNEDGELVVSGTPEYLAPELVCGAPPSVTSDLYAVAIVLYELIAGATPFGGGTSAQIMSRQIDQIASPLSWRCDVPTELDDVVACALAKTPSKRFPDATSMRRALRRAARSAADEPAAQARASKRWAETPTVTIGVAPTIHADSSDPMEQKRRALLTAVDSDDPDAIVVAYLELARAHVDAHDLRRAIIELEAGVELVTKCIGACKSLWRLSLTLAALYDGCGERVRARIAARQARAQAVRARSELGRTRANELCVRLHTGRNAVRR